MPGPQPSRPTAARPSGGHDTHRKPSSVQSAVARTIPQGICHAPLRTPRTPPDRRRESRLGCGRRPGRPVAQRVRTGPGQRRHCRPRRADAGAEDPTRCPDRAACPAPEPAPHCRRAATRCHNRPAAARRSNPSVGCPLPCLAQWSLPRLHAPREPMLRPLPSPQRPRHLTRWSDQGQIPVDFFLQLCTIADTVPRVNRGRDSCRG